MSAAPGTRTWPWSALGATLLWLVISPMTWLFHLNARSPCGWKAPPDTCTAPPKPPLWGDVGDALWALSAVLVVVVGWWFGRRSALAGVLAVAVALVGQFLALLAFNAAG